MLLIPSRLFSSVNQIAQQNDERSCIVFFALPSSIVFYAESHTGVVGSRKPAKLLQLSPTILEYSFLRFPFWCRQLNCTKYVTSLRSFCWSYRIFVHTQENQLIGLSSNHKGYVLLNHTIFVPISLFSFNLQLLFDIDLTFLIIDLTFFNDVFLVS